MYFYSKFSMESRVYGFVKNQDNIIPKTNTKVYKKSQRCSAILVFMKYEYEQCNSIHLNLLGHA